MIDESSEFGARAARHLRDETVVWLTTVTQSASPLSVGSEHHLDARALTAWKDPGVGSPQTLSQADRRIVAVWAADCAERVLGLFEAKAPGDSRPR